MVVVMKSIQFNFSLFVGVVLNVLGIIILQEDRAGLGLIIASAVLLLVTFLTKNSTPEQKHVMNDKSENQSAN